MELHEEWSKAENGDTVLMGLFWLCYFCHVKREGHWLDEEESELTRTTMILTGWKVSKLNGFPINSEYEWNLIDIDGEIEEIRRRDDYSPRGGRYHLGFYWGKPEDTCIIDFGPNYIEARRIFFLDVRESIWSSQTYQSTLKNPPEPSELGNEIQIEHIIGGMVPDEGIECYKTGLMYGPWYYRYYGDNFAFDFQLAYDADSDSLPWGQEEEYTGNGIDDYVVSSYVIRDGVCFVLPELGDGGYSKEQIMHFCSLFVKKYGDLPPSTLFGPALRMKLGMATFDPPPTHQKIPLTTMAVRMLVSSIWNNTRGFGEIRESLGLPRMHGQAGPLGHPYRKISNSGFCQCGKRHNGILKHRDECT
ncbi:uncharacterized protein METZ01_LOCUS202680, partial [marine metagenome]